MGNYVLELLEKKQYGLADTSLDSTLQTSVYHFAMVIGLGSLKKLRYA